MNKTLLFQGPHAAGIKTEASGLVHALPVSLGGPSRWQIDTRHFAGEHPAPAEGPGAGAVRHVTRVIEEKMPAQVLSRTEQVVAAPLADVAIPWLHGHQPMSR